MLGNSYEYCFVHLLHLCTVLVILLNKTEERGPNVPQQQTVTEITVYFGSACSQLVSKAQI